VTWEEVIPAPAIVSSRTSCLAQPASLCLLLLLLLLLLYTTHTHTHTHTCAHRYNADLERVVRARVRRGRHFPIMKVIPPGLDFSNLKISPPPDPLEALNSHGSGEGLGWQVCKGWVLWGRTGWWAGCGAMRRDATNMQLVTTQRKSAHTALYSGLVQLGGVGHTLTAAAVAAAAVSFDHSRSSWSDGWITCHARLRGAALGGLKPVASNGSLSGKCRRRSSAGSNWAIALGLCHSSHGDLMQLHSPGSNSPSHSTGGYVTPAGKWLHTHDRHISHLATSLHVT
jgi:hypothetical protein